MELSNSTNMRQADRAAIDGGIPSTVLMENAAGYLADEVYSVCGPEGRICAFCGSGNNGGDGIAAAKDLIQKGCSVRVFLAGNREHLSADSAEMERRLISAGGALEDYSGSDDQLNAVENADVLIDALLGTGLNREVGGKALECIQLINESSAAVISADVPSGIDADNGIIRGEAVKADVTVTFAMGKAGLFTDPGCAYSKKVKIVDIGIPDDILKNSGCKVFLLTEKDVSLPARDPLSHKGDHGKVFIAGGHVGYTGAPSLCAKAALRSGAGLVYLAVPESIYDITAVKNDEAMPSPYPDSFGGFAASAEDVALEKLSACDVGAIGPGIGRDAGTMDFVREIISKSTVPLVLDADALYAVSRDPDLLKKVSVPLVLTPHEGEFRRLQPEFSGDRIKSARDFAAEYGCVLVLKGHRTLAAFPDGEVYLSPCGNPGMAKGGSGDVLTGIIAAMMGQFPLKKAVTTGIYLHSLAGDMCRDEKGEYAMTASDIIEKLPPATMRIFTS